MIKDKIVIQEFYSEEFAQCYGCGRLNKDGLQIKTWWDKGKIVSKFTPKKYHTAIEGYVYGGLIASLIDCHGTASGSLAYVKENNIELIKYNAPRFVTANLQVNYRKPTPMNMELILVGSIVKVSGRKVVTDIELLANDTVCVTGQVVAVLVPDDF